MSEFQVATASAQDVLIDSVLASAITAAGGSVEILLLVYRDEARALFDRPDFVLRTFQLVRERRDDPLYSRAYFAPSAPALAQQASPDTSGLTASSRAPWERLALALRATLRRWWTALAASSATVAAPIETPPQPKQEAAVGPVEPPAPEGCGQTIKFQMVVKARCRSGRQIDEDGIDRGICPNCLGRVVA